MACPSSKSTIFTITFLGIYFIWLLINMGQIIPHYDSFYYWDWSRHPALSYYDGPPLVAYTLAIYTKIFGNTLFTINLFSFTTTYATGFIIYKSSRLLMDKRASLTAMALWVASPIVTQYLIRQATYDNVLNLFWALSIYSVLQFVHSNKNSYLYWSGIALGLTMLAKYSGIVLILSLLIFSFIVPRFRKLYSNLHFYLAMLIILAVFSPVIIWNVQHHWISITYQATNHIAQITSPWNHVSNILKTVGIQSLLVYNYLIVIIVYGYSKCRFYIQQNQSLQLLLIISIVFTLFYIVIGLFIRTHASWLLPFCISGSILSTYFLSQLKMHKTSIILLIIYFLSSLLILLVNGFFAKRFTTEGAQYATIQKFNKQYGTQHPPIITSSWMSARIVFFLAGQPTIYTLPCFEENEYQYWNKRVRAEIESKKIKKVLYVDFLNQHECMAEYFTQCKKLPAVTYKQHKLLTGKTKLYQLNVYSCTNS